MSLNKSSLQTQSYLIRRFREVGIMPHTHYGQNFLIDMNLQRLLVETARLSPKDVVLEVGTGTGALTAMMARQAGAVVTVELDGELFRLASEELDGLDNVTMLEADVLANKNRLNPVVMDAVAQQVAAKPGRRFKMLANLPYNIATPLMSNLLACPTPPVSMTGTIQKELADRIVARPGRKSYGALSIWMQSQCRVEIVRTMPPDVFWPRPKVTSAITQIVRDDALRGRIDDLAFFHQFVRSMFFHRRKFLRSELLGAMKNQLDKPQVDEVMASQGLAGDARAEQLDVEQMLALCHAIQAELK